MENLIRCFEASHKAILKYLITILASLIIFIAVTDASNYEIIVLGDVDETIEVYKEADFWGEIDRSKPLDVPRAMIVVINKSWREEAKHVSVDVKKELFFRGLDPLILYANELILQDRQRLKSLIERHKAVERIEANEMRWIGELAVRYKLVKPESSPDDRKLLALLDDLLMRVDNVPPASARKQKWKKA